MILLKHIKYEKENPFYLTINKMNFTHLYTIIKLYRLNGNQNSNIKYFYNNFNNIRILRNSLSHGDGIQMHLNRLKEEDYKKVIKNIQKLNKLTLNLEINYSLLSASYHKYNQKYSIT